MGDLRHIDVRQPTRNLVADIGVEEQPDDREFTVTQRGPSAPSINNVTQFTCENADNVAEKGDDRQKKSWQPFGRRSALRRVLAADVGRGDPEQWAYAAPGFDAGHVNGPAPSFPTDTVLQDMFARQPNQNGGFTQPLFNSQSFPLEAYADGADANVISQANYTWPADWPSSGPSTTELCSTATP